MFDTKRDKLRDVFFTAWQKYQGKELLNATESLIVDVILAHPEYHKTVSSPEKYRDKNYLPELGETNPFLHMSAHLGLQEQIKTNRPKGINHIYQTLIKKFSDHHHVEHLMSETMMEVLWQAQKNNCLPDDKVYLKKLKKLLK